MAIRSGFLYNERYTLGGLLKVRKGDTIYLTEAPDGSYRLTPYDPEFERQMALAETVMHEDREILRLLAK